MRKSQYNNQYCRNKYNQVIYYRQHTIDEDCEI